MRYFVTENGTVLKLDDSYELSVLIAAHWELLAKCIPPIPPRDEKAAVVEASQKHPVQHNRFRHLASVQLPAWQQSIGYVHINADTKIAFVDVTELISAQTPWPKSLDTADEIKALWNNQYLRALLAKKAFAKSRSSTDKSSGRDSAALFANDNSISNYNSLVKFATLEMARLRKPFTYNGRAKAEKIQLALNNMMSAELNWPAPPIENWTKDDKILGQRSYVQLAQESGLIAALQWHRFSWSGKARRGQPTKAFENLEIQSPGISKLI